MGWSDVKIENSCPLSEGIKEGDRFYYVHSYKAVTDQRYVSLYSEYGEYIPVWFFQVPFTEPSSTQRKAEKSA
jgi:imidazoleglycerol phosphate synthase glutamine amidotransferase subunit HisH